VRAILDENVRSLQAAEQMLLALAQPADASRAGRFAQALALAEGNITEPGERPVLTSLRRQHQAALDGDPQALATTLADLERLTQINHRSMELADQRAMRLGDAGAWAMAVLGIICFGLSLFATRRTARLITLPLAHIHRSVAAFRQGDTLRRCHVPDAALEPAELATAVNQLLDQVTAAPATPPAPAQLAGQQLLPLLEALPLPALALQGDGQLTAANSSALAALAADPSLRQRVRERRQQDSAEPLVAQVLTLGDSLQVVLLALPAGAAEKPSNASPAEKA
jgi:hypothetical protein